MIYRGICGRLGKLDGRSEGGDQVWLAMSDIGTCQRPRQTVCMSVGGGV